MKLDKDMVVIGFGVMCLAATAGIDAYRDYKIAETTEIIEYTKTVEEGETVWSICSNVADSREDLRKLVYQTIEDNGIKSAGELQVGQTITVRVREARKNAVNGN